MIYLQKTMLWFLLLLCFVFKEIQNINKNRHQTVIQMKLKYLQAHQNFKGLLTIDIP